MREVVNQNQIPWIFHSCVDTNLKICNICEKVVYSHNNGIFLTYDHF